MAINPDDITTVRVGELPSAAFSLTDLMPHEVGTDLKSGTIQDLITFITPFVGAIQFQVISLHVNSAYIAANFDVTGLGINLMEGYAICNGNNGTINKDGRVGVAYGSTTNVIGQYGGSKDAVLPSHFHFQYVNEVNTGGAGVGVVTNTKGVARSASGKVDFNYEAGFAGADGVDTATLGRSSTAGTSSIGANMQPYIVELHVMRL